MEIRWGNDVVDVRLRASDDRPLEVGGFGLGGAADLGSPRPAIEVLSVEDGHSLSSQRVVGTTLGQRFRYTGHEEERDGAWRQIVVRAADPVSGLEASLVLSCHDGVAALRSHVELRGGTRATTVLSVSSLALRTPHSSDAQLTRGTNEWLGENRWASHPLGLVDLNLGPLGLEASGAVTQISLGNRSTGTGSPTGMLEFPTAGASWMWQIEHNGAWRWEVGQDHLGTFLAASGPTDTDHHFAVRLSEGERFISVPVSLAVGANPDAALAAMTDQRRLSRRSHPDNAARPIIFNDYMNTVMADPTTEKLLPLIDAAAQTGAEIFCIDAGWYSEDGVWWDTVGEWTASRSRFPGGFGEVVDRIREGGMKPGLWLEPEVLGVRSPAVAQLPPDALFTRFGAPSAEQGRHSLDLRHPAVRERLDAVIDRLVAEFGIEYFKFDYNIDPGPGTDLGGHSPGAGLLAHNRAHLEWIDDILDRHPELVLENCASGGLRADFAMLSRMQLQSTSDQMSSEHYAPIAASAPIAMLPEQAANWACPQPGMTDEEIILTLCTPMLGRFMFSGHVDRMTAEELDLVREALAAHKEIRGLVGEGYPIWPAGLPQWDAPTLATALLTSGGTLLTVWSRRGSEQLVLALPHFTGADVEVVEVFPRGRSGWQYTWSPGDGTLVADVSADVASARTVLVRAC